MGNIAESDAGGRRPGGDERKKENEGHYENVNSARRCINFLPSPDVSTLAKGNDANELRVRCSELASPA